jgi:EAL domain-containing protein (putative c-di-GMP-specific phosphodiesterase class I)
VARKKKEIFFTLIKVSVQASFSFGLDSNILVSARSKILKPVGVNPDELELQVAQNILDLEHNAKELKADLRGLQFTAAKEVF